ncbi:MAG: MBL fold metallo-hydrolase [Helicobacteraceae bacterium]|jgi:L-ascorbate metabolism protein UlaG (beta-lactamase superfamily)|nr:MBL fold metallo-hydrolase [Helicobacteraceae bacterium]
MSSGIVDKIRLREKRGGFANKAFDTIAEVKKYIKAVLIVLLAALLAVGAVGIRAYLEIGHTPNAEDFARYEGLEYFKNGRFQSPEDTPSYPDRIRGGRGGWARFLTRSPNAPKDEIPKVKPVFGAPNEELAAYWLGHSSLIIEIEGERILVDPVFGNAAPIPFAVGRFTPPVLTPKELPPIDIVLITHDHYDHLEYATIRALRESVPRFVVPLGVGAHLAKWGVDRKKITELGWDENLSFGALTIAADRTIHYSGRTFGSRAQTLWVSYALLGERNRAFISGDSGYGEHYAAIGEKYGGFDLAFIEIDGWNPGWPKTHMFPEEVIKAYRDIKARAFVPVHWGVFDLALHPWKESIEMIASLADSEGDVVLLTPLMGEKIEALKTDTSRWYEALE